MTEGSGLRDVASIFQALFVGGSLCWAAFTYHRESQNKRFERTKILVERYMSTDFSQKRKRLKKILNDDRDHIDSIVKARNEEWLIKREAIKDILNDYEVTIMMSEKKYYDKNLLRELWGDAIYGDYQNAKEFISRDREESKGLIQEVEKLYEEIEKFCNEHHSSAATETEECN